VPAPAPVDVAQATPPPVVSPPAPAPAPAPTPAPATSPVIRTFTADASTARARLCYSVTHADSLTLSPRPGELGTSLQDCVTVALDSPTTFTLTARSDGKTVRKTLRVAPLPAAAPLAAPAPAPAAAPAPAMAAVPAAPAAPVAVANSPLPMKGERWVYRSSGKWSNSPRRTFEIVAQSVSNGLVTDALKILEPAGGGGELKRSRGTQPDFVTWGSIGFEFSPYFGAYLNLAQQGTLKGFPTPDLDPRFGQWYSEAKMLGRETVTVPAGTFRAYKVEVWSSRSPTSLDSFTSTRRGFGSSGDKMEPTRVHYLIWYAPEAKRYVRMQRSVTSAANTESDKDLFELVSHTLP
jgi:hypothetical protein